MVWHLSDTSYWLRPVIAEATGLRPIIIGLSNLNREARPRFAPPVT